ncbi:hypothetical protein ACQEUU_36920 [Nonomuraea sp. CA-218870]
MTEIQRLAAAYAICGFSQRISELHKLDREDFFDAFVPPQRRPS